MKKYLILIIPVLFLFLSGCTNQSDQKEVNQEVENKQDEIVSEENENEVESTDEKAKGGITINGIKADDTLESPVLIEGEANIESKMVIVELRNNEHEAVSSSIEAVVRDGKYKISEFWFKFRNTKEGFVAVYDKDNSENIVEIPVKFQTVE